MIQLRPYQEDFVGAIREAFRTHRRVLAVAPTGAGKTVCFVYITTSSVAKGKRITIVAHRQEIVDQISAALDAFGVRHGRIQAGHTPTDDPVQVAMVITLGLRIGKVKPADFLVIDESHHVNAASYTKIIEAWPDARILGVTATPTRLDGKPLGKHFDTMVLGPSVKSLIDAGFLAPFTYLAPPEKADLSGVKTVNGDYDIQSLAAAMNRAVITGDAVEHARTYLTGKPAIAFCVTVQHAEDVAAQFREAGFRAASVDGSMGTLERRDLIRSIGDGRLDILTSCAIISEGTDIPIVGGAILLRPTQSLSVHLQQVGRALRPKPDGSKAVILDHVGNVKKHGLPDMDREWSLTVKTKRANPGVTTCDICYKAFQPYPGWTAEAECGSDDFHPPGCVLKKVREAAPKALPAFDPAQLVEYRDQTFTKPAWANGLDIKTAIGPDWFELLRRANTKEQLAEIARARNYKYNWVRNILAKRAKRHQNAAE